MSGKYLTNEQFIQKARLVHGDKYNYPGIYVGSKTKMLMSCTVCGHEFLQKPGDHINSRAGCPNCKKITLSLLKNQRGMFVERSRAVHGDKYDYTDSEKSYVDCDTKVPIICPVDGVFMQEPYKHYNGSGCPSCWMRTNIINLNKRNKDGILSTQEVLKRFRDVHGDKWGYDKFVYYGMKKKSIYECSDHGEFYQSPQQHLNGLGCPVCTHNSRFLTTEEFIQQSKSVFGDYKFGYNNTSYQGAHSPVTLTCLDDPNHGDFVINKACWHIYNKNGCPTCSTAGKSRLEAELIDYIRTLVPYDIKTSIKIPNSNLELDGYIHDISFAVEFNGLYWHSEDKKGKSYHRNKTELCEEAGIVLIHVFEDDWLWNPDIVKDRISKILAPTERVLTNPLVKMIDDISEYKSFVDLYSLSVDDSCDQLVGLYEDGELVTAIVIDSSNIVVGFCEKIGFRSSVGIGLMLDFIYKNIDSDVRVSLDRGWYPKNVENPFVKHGFVFDSFIDEDYSYVDGGRIRYPKSDIDLAYVEDYERIWDCGKSLYKRNPTFSP